MLALSGWNVGTVKTRLVIVKIISRGHTDLRYCWPVRYHHGDLPNALRQAAVAVIEERGLGGFSLREVARRAGVSHAAPAHHFGDSEGLLTSLAVEAFQHLHGALSAARAGAETPAEQLIACARAYVEVSLSSPGHCSVMYRKDVVDCFDPEYIEWGLKAFGVLEAVLRDLQAAHNPKLDVANAARLCWSMVEGVVVLHENMARIAELQGVPIEAPLDLVERLASISLAGLLEEQ